jgi:orotidine 5'-phosphate decarboxylase subfamily 1
MIKNKIILAIDESNFNVAKELCQEVASDVGFFKLGLEFFYSFGSDGVNEISKLGVPIFLDLKLHDIPNTVSKACTTLMQKVKGVEMLTLHSSGGIKMLADTKEALKSLAIKQPMIFGVTVLTSTKGEGHQEHIVSFPFALATLRAINTIERFKKTDDAASLNLVKAKLKLMIEVANGSLGYWTHLSLAEKTRIEEVNRNSLIQELALELKFEGSNTDFYQKNISSGGILNTVLHLSSIANEAEIDGIVCSALEAKFVKTFFPSLKIITPGIRPNWYKEKDDQERILTPNEAIKQGADFIVIGRPITKNANPKEALLKTLHEMQ